MEKVTIRRKVDRVSFDTREFPDRVETTVDYYVGDRVVTEVFVVSKVQKQGLRR